MGSVGSSNHLEFKKIPLEKGLKLHKYEVISDHYYYKIGEIHWRGGWRKYVFRAYPEVDMDKKCHKQIDDFTDKLMDEWKNKQKAKGEGE